MTQLRPATPDELARWDELVRRFDNHRVTHLRAWVESLVDAGCGSSLYLVFERDSEIIGCLPGLLASVAGFRLYGSPLEGWQTVSMGPCYDPSRLTSAEIAGLVVPYLERVHKVVHIELMDLGEDEAAMRAAGFESEVVPTYRAPLLDEARTVKNLKDSARRNVKRAQRLGLEVKVETDESFVAEHFRQLKAVYLRGGHVIPFSERRLLACFRQLQRSGNLLALSVYLPGGAINIATGMFFIEGRELYLWMWAHDHHYRWYRPTELLTWTAMQAAIARGCTTFDLMGRGDFKAKFGAELDETKRRWTRSRPQWLMRLRGVAGSGFRLQQRLRGKAGQLAARARGADRDTAAAAFVLGDADLVRALSLGGVPSVVVAPPGSPSRYSRAASSRLPWIDPWDRPAEMVDMLVEAALRQSEPPVLFYQEDRSLLLVSRHRDRLRQAFRFVIADAKLVEDLVDKQRFQQLAAKLKLPVPPARRMKAAEEAAPTEHDLAFPVIVKPVMRRNDVWQRIVPSGKAMRADRAADLAALWPLLAAERAEVLVQSLVEGPESSIESYHTYVDERGSIVADFTGRKVRTWPVEYGDTTALEITGAADVQSLGRDIVGRLGLRGVAKLDFKRAPDGTLYLLEVNPRFTLWHHGGACAGVNIPAMVYADLSGRPRPEPAQARAGVRWCKVWSDRSAARASGIPLSRWVPWVLGCEARSAFAWDDPFPLIGAVLWRTLGRGTQLSKHPASPAGIVTQSVATAGGPPARI